MFCSEYELSYAFAVCFTCSKLSSRFECVMLCETMICWTYILLFVEGSVGVFGCGEEVVSNFGSYFSLLHSGDFIKRPES